MATNPMTLIEKIRSNLHAQIDQACNDAIAQLSPGQAPSGIVYKTPTLADGQDPRNKNGLNLTPRGAEILYRVFDDGGGYNRAAKMLGISQGAAKNRKGIWTKLGCLNRTKLVLDIDTL
jgi:DNA-binding NarL/FixJ family response regulator